MRDKAKEALELSARIQSMLAGLGPDLQGAILADLVSLWAAGHHPDLRNVALANWIDTMKALIPASEKQIAERHGGLPWK